jgi:beta-fructofuranosidase
VPVGQDAMSIAWASNWQYAQSVPTGPLEGWRSAMSLPRQNFLTNATRIGMMMASTLGDLGPILGDGLASNRSLGNESLEVDYSSVLSNALYLAINATNVNASLSSTDSTINFTFSSPVSN